MMLYVDVERDMWQIVKTIDRPTMSEILCYLLASDGSGWYHGAAKNFAEVVVRL